MRFCACLREGFLRRIVTVLLSAALLCAPFDFAQAAKAKPHKPARSAVEAVQQVVLPKPDRPQLVVDVATGNVLHAQEARTLWHPASLTKMMTAYVAFRAIQSGRARFDTPLTISANATNQKPSKMGFKPGSIVTLEAALYMIMVKSANDMSVAIAEGLSGSVPAFVAEMNSVSRQLGMNDTNWANPNGLPDEAQITSARDLAILARALIRDFPQLQAFLSTPAIQVGDSIIRNHNNLIGRFDGADGMKTGYICDSGFNIVATATRGGRRVIAVVLGGDSAKARDEWTALLLEKAFAGQSRQPGRGFFNANAAPAQVTLANLPAANANNVMKMKPFVCGRNKKTDMDSVTSEILAFAPGAAAGLTAMPWGAEKPAAPKQRVSLLGPREMPRQPLLIALDKGDPSRGIPLRAAVAGRELPPLPPGVASAEPLPLTVTPPASGQAVSAQKKTLWP